MTEEKLKHIEFIQAIVTRMNANSFQIKSWAVAIVSALLAIYASNKNEWFILVGIFPVIIFWFLDTYYLMQERKFRGLYDDVAGVSDQPQKLKDFEMRPDLYKGGKYSFLCVLKSGTIAFLYLPIVIILLGLFVILKYYCQGG